jgi:hypothetical protein
MARRMLGNGVATLAQNRERKVHRSFVETERHFYRKVSVACGVKNAPSCRV